MESWRLVWRNGFAPAFSDAGLHALAKALRDDDPRLHQGATTTPPPLMYVQDWPCEAADAIGFVGWQGDDLKTVGEVEEFFARSCFEADQRLGEPAACRWFLNWWDDTPRSELFADMLAEVERELAGRLGGFAGRMPMPFQAAYVKNPDDETLLGAIADYLRDEGDETGAHAWDCQRQRVIQKERGHGL